MSRHTIISSIGIVLFCFLLVLPAIAQEKLTSYLGEAETSYIPTPVEFNGKLYSILTEPRRKMVVYEYDPALNTSEILFREDRVEGFSIIKVEVIYGRLLVFDANTIFEVDVENKQLLTIRKFDELGWVTHVYHNEDLLYIIGPTDVGSSQYHILIYNLHDDFIVDHIYDSRIRYGLTSLKDRRSKIPGDEIILTFADDRTGIYIYDMTRQTLSIPSGAEEAFDKNLDGFVLQGDSTYIFYDRQKTVWSLNMNSHSAHKVIQVDSAKTVRAPYLTDNYIVVPAIESHLDFTADSYVYRKHLETNDIDTSFFPSQSLRNFDRTDDHGAFTEVRSQFSYIDFETETITPKNNYEEWDFTGYMGYDATNEKVYFTARNEDYQYALFSSSKKSDSSELSDFPLSLNFIAPIYSSDTLILFRNYSSEHGTIVSSIKNEEIVEVLQVFSGFEGHDFHLYDAGPNLYGSNHRDLLFDVEVADSPVLFPGPPNPSSYKNPFVSLADHLYVTDISERNVLWEIKSGQQSAKRIELSHPDSIPISAAELYVANGRLYTELRVSGREHLCSVDIETGTLDCLIDTSDFNEFGIWGGPVWLGNQLCFHLDTKKNGRELWAITKEISESYIVMDLSPDSTDDQYARNVIRGDERSIFNTTPASTHGLMSSDGTQEGTFQIKSGFTSVKTHLYYDGYFYLSLNNVLLRTKGLSLNGEENLVYTDRALYHFPWRNNIYFVSTITNPAILKRYELESDEIIEVTELDRWPRDYYPSSSHLFYVTDEGDYLSLWSTDGTPQNSHQLIEKIGRWRQDEPLFVVGDKILFSHYDKLNGSELWISDGTPEGTDLFLDINPGAINSYPLVLFDHGGYVYFSAEYEQEGRQLFRIDRKDVSLASSLSEVKSSPLEIYPNPTQDYLQMSAPGDGIFENVRIFSADGTAIKNMQSVASGQRVSLEGISPGIYFISAERAAIFYSSRFVKAE